VNYYLKNDSWHIKFVSITGLKVEDSNFLLPYFKAEWDEYNEFFTLDGLPRQRKSYSRVNTF